MTAETNRRFNYFAAGTAAVGIPLGFFLLYNGLWGPTMVIGFLLLAAGIKLIFLNKFTKQ